MKITEIKRTVSGHHYDNITATATVSEDESPVEVAKQLDSIIRESLDAIEARRQRESDERRKKEQFLSNLRSVMRRVESGECDGLPF